jgi:LysR family glycine cleavage system transcriptional activator
MGGTETGVYSQVLVREWLTPMVAPQLADQLRTPRDLLGLRLLEDGNLDFVCPPCDWPTWFRAMGIPDAPRVTPQFTQADHAIDAAETGGGAILGRISLTTKALQDGRLVIPFPTAITTQAHYRVLCPEEATAKPQVKAFLSWLTEKVAEIGQIDRKMTFVDVATIPA